MLKRTFRVYALSLTGGALLLGEAMVAAGAMTLRGSLPGGVTEPSMAAIVAGGDTTAKVEQIWWRGGRWCYWHPGACRGWGWHGGWGWRGARWCYWHPYACRSW